MKCLSIKALLPTLITVMLTMASCAPKDITLFQDRQPGTVQNYDSLFNVTSIPFKLRPGDEITIRITSRNSMLTTQFNMTGGKYLVDENGMIEMPVLGDFKVEGLNRKELQDTLKNLLRETRLVDDAMVNVDYTGLYVVLLGQNGGRRVPLIKDRMDFFEFMASIGDVNIEAKRKNILVIRNEDGIISQYEIDITNMKSVVESPAFYLHQNDIVYIEPKEKVKRRTSFFGNMFDSWGFWAGQLGLSGVTIYSLIRNGFKF